MRYIHCFLLICAPQATVFEFTSLDVEGAEMLVLQSIDFNQISFEIMFIEANEHNPLLNSLADNYFGG